MIFYRCNIILKSAQKQEANTGNKQLINQLITVGGAPGTCAGHIACVANAGYTQQAVVTVTDALGTIVASGTFEGSGEGNTPVPLISGGSVLSYTNAVLPVTLNAQFNYSPDGSKFLPNEPDKVSLIILYHDDFSELVQISAEDSVDGDFNDIIMTSVTIRH